MAQLFRTDLVTVGSVDPLNVKNAEKFLPLTMLVQRKSAQHVGLLKKIARKQKIITPPLVCLQSRQKEIADWYKFFE